MGNREDLAWVAGLFDGEGCFHAQKANGKYYLRSQLSQSGSPELLYRCQKITGLGAVGGPYKPTYPRKCKDRFCWAVAGFEQTQALIALLWEWLGTAKREQAVTGLRKHGQPIHEQNSH